MIAEAKGPGAVVLVVDDDRFVRESIGRLLAGDVEVVGVPSADEGLAVFGAREVDVVLADYRMKGTDGVQFLRGLRTTHPRATRLLMSGFLDQNTFTRFLSSGLVSAFVAKPWDEAQLRALVAHVVSLRSILGTRKLLDLVNGLGSLPTLPTLYTELVVAVESQKPMKEIAALLERDAAVAARLIHVANSAYFGHREVGSISDAAVLLGASLLKDLVLTTELAQGTAWNAAQLEELERIFQHSLVVNRLLPAVHKVLWRRVLDASMGSAGIVHDIGKVLLLRSFPVLYEATLAAAQAGAPDAFWRAELGAGNEGATHAELGAWLLDFWNLPRPLVEAALFHHDPARGHGEGERIANVTAVANRLVHLAEGSAAEGEAVAALGLRGPSRDDLGRLFALVKRELDGVRARFRLR